MLWLIAAALAAVPVRLPPGQSAELWARPLSLAGLGVGTGGAGAYVELIDEGSRWRVRVHDRAGAVRETWVRPPADEAAREDVAWLALSLLEPVVSTKLAAPEGSSKSALTLPPPPAPLPPPSAPKPSAPRTASTGTSVSRAASSTSTSRTTATVSTPAAPEPKVAEEVVVPVEPGEATPSEAPLASASASASAASAEGTPDPAADASTELDPSAAASTVVIVAAEPSPWSAAPLAAEVAAPATAAEKTAEVLRDPSPLRLHGTVGTGMGWRPGHTPTSSSWLRVDADVSDELSVGLMGSFESPSVVGVAGEGRLVTAADLFAVAGAHIGGRVAVQAGLGVGVAGRWFTEDGVVVQAGPIPVAGAEVGAGFAIGSWVRLGPEGMIRVDLRPTEVSVDAGVAEALSPVELRLGLSLRIGRDRADPSAR